MRNERGRGEIHEPACRQAGQENGEEKEKLRVL